MDLSKAALHIVAWGRAWFNTLSGSRCSHKLSKTFVLLNLIPDIVEVEQEVKHFLSLLFI